MANLQQFPMSGLENKEKVSLTECKRQDPEEDPQMAKGTRKSDIDGFPDCSSKLELGI